MTFIFIIASLIAGAGGQNDTGFTCQDRSSLYTCLQQLPPILEQSELKGIPSSKKDVDASCRAFKEGMKCIDDYADACLNRRNRRILEDHVAGARHTFRFLCDDPSFQSEYLRYTSCYRGISANWDFCANRFLSLVGEELARKNASKESRLVELCCAKHGFERCVFVAARLKCLKEEALFIKKIAETLSSMRVYSPYCKSVDIAVCSGAAVLYSTSCDSNWFIYLFFVISFLLSLDLQ
ncbi:uncharacterized protein LOC142318296 [Lycorma delicatula]|uniref:uncharacterized protein LOC142318296 n=1 Tax=Lycorma delicatula TaxID=130591 RepID=UPI003F51279F